MIEQIKQWRINNEEQYYGLDKETVNEILFKLDEIIGEVERLEYERGSLSLKLHGELKKERNQLQKALEWYASDEFARVVKNYYFGETTIEDIGNPARKALQSIQGGDTK